LWLSGLRVRALRTKKESMHKQSVNASGRVEIPSNAALLSTRITNKDTSHRHREIPREYSADIFKLERCIWEREERFRILAEAQPHLIWLLHANGSVEYVNRSWRDYVGWNSEDTPRELWDGLLHPDDR